MRTVAEPPDSRLLPCKRGSAGQGSWVEGAARLICLILGLVQAGIGLWALISPRGWFVTFPGAGKHWLGRYGPFDEHLAFDVGAAYCSQAVLMVVAASRPRGALSLALITYVAFSLPHAVFHWIHDPVLGDSDRLLNGLVLAVTALIPLLLLCAMAVAGLRQRQGPAGHASTSGST